MSCCCSPTEQLSGFLKDAKDTLKVIEEVNEKIYAGQLNLDRVAVLQVNRVPSCNRIRHEGEVAVVSLDILSMYTTPTCQRSLHQCL